MATCRVVSMITLTVTCWLLLEGCCAQNNPRRRQRNRNVAGRRNDGLPPNLQEAYQNAYGGHNRPVTQPETTRSPWEEFAPSTPASNAIECEVEIQTVRRLGGRCTRLGGFRQQPYICQSGLHFEFNPECEHIIEERGEGR